MSSSQNTIKQKIAEQIQLLDEKESETVLVFIKNLLRKDPPEIAQKKAEAIQTLRKLQAEAEKNGLTQEILDQIVTGKE